MNSIVIFFFVQVGTKCTTCTTVAIAIAIVVAAAAPTAADDDDDDDKYEYADKYDVAPAAHSLFDSEIDVCPKTSSIVVSTSPVLTVSQNVTSKDIHGVHHLNIPNSLMTR
mmetsp:Transcript_14063/g.15282  ORF Transcript_14063/g.15282 Transcript_14063/m.15282 type:complete len:111 (-) Transcript_14063:37-369(-)